MHILQREGKRGGASGGHQLGMPAGRGCSKRNVKEEGTQDRETSRGTGTGERKLEAGEEGWSTIGGRRQGKRYYGRRGQGDFRDVSGGYFGILGEALCENIGKGTPPWEEDEVVGSSPLGGERAEERVGVKGVGKKQGSKGTLADFEEILEAAREQFKGEGAMEGVGARGKILGQGMVRVRARDQRGTKTVAEGRGVGPETGMVELANRYETN